jgi:hypothetical protein
MPMVIIRAKRAGRFTRLERSFASTTGRTLSLSPTLASRSYMGLAARASF